MGPAVAIKLEAGFCANPQAWKTSYKVIEKHTARNMAKTIQIHAGCLTKDDVVLIHDDLLATGGTMVGIQLVKKLA